jgi:RNA polymerase-binding transcription factor DksA
MKASDAMIETAEARVAQEVDAGVVRIQAALSRQSRRLVCDCGDEISPERRKAVPYTDKCVDCASRAERLRRRA